MRPIKLAIFYLTLFFSPLFLVGCPQNADLPHNSIPSVGSHIDKADAHIDAATYAANQVKRHADATGNAIIGIVNNEHVEAKKDLKGAQADLVKAEKERDELAKQIDGLKGDLKASDAKYNRVFHSVGYQCQLWVTRFFVLVLILVGIHFIAGAAAIFVPMFVPPPYGQAVGSAAAMVAKSVNPFGWFQWLFSNFEAYHAANAAKAQPAST